MDQRYALYRLPRGGFEIAWGGNKVGQLIRDGVGWKAMLTETDSLADMPAPFARFEYAFGSLVDVLAWLGNPEVKQRSESER